MFMLTHPEDMKAWLWLYACARAQNTPSSVVTALVVLVQAGLSSQGKITIVQPSWKLADSRKWFSLKYWILEHYNCNSLPGFLVSILFDYYYYL